MDLILALVKFAVPLVTKVISDYKASHNGAEPTDEEILATFHANIDSYLAEGAAWRLLHPKQP
jgi:hypothetical protein